jgi:hypothetical protein
MGDEIIIDDKGQAAGAGEVLAIHEPATYKGTEYRLRCANILTGKATDCEVSIATAKIKTSKDGNSPESFFETPSGATIVSFLVEAAADFVRGDYANGKMTLSTNTKLSAFYVKVGTKHEMFYSATKATISRITIWYRNSNGLLLSATAEKPKELSLLLELHPAS